MSLLSSSVFFLLHYTRSRTQHVFPFEWRCFESILCCWLTFFFASALVLRSAIILFNSRLFLLQNSSVMTTTTKAITMDRLVANSADWKLFRLTVHDVKIISPCERRCDCDHLVFSLFAAACTLFNLLHAHSNTLWPRQLYFGSVSVATIVSSHHVLSVFFLLLLFRFVGVAHHPLWSVLAHLCNLIQ